MTEQNRDNEILHRFDTLKPTVDALRDMRDMRLDFQVIATVILAVSKPSREQSLALTALEEAKFWTNQAIALHGAFSNEEAGQ
jgi:hypothetical protein